RAGWLGLLFIMQMFTFEAMAHYDNAMKALTVLALFVPLCLSVGGNAGSQAATLITRSLALGQVSVRDWVRVLRHELVMGLALGARLGMLGLARTWLFTPSDILDGASLWNLTWVIGLSVAAICLWGTLIGSLLPLLIKRLGLDPAHASSPAIATISDVTGIA